MNTEGIAQCKEETISNRENIITNREDISSNRENISVNREDISLNREDIKNNKDEISSNKIDIQILNSTHQALLDRFEKSNLKFHVETKKSTLPINTVVTYEKKLVDTHSAVDLSSGTFTAPFDGIYAFYFFGLFHAHDSDWGTDSGSLYAFHNDLKIKIFYRYSSEYEGSLVHFALDLKRNDKVKINSGSFDISAGYYPAKFMGFLLE